MAIKNVLLNATETNLLTATAETVILSMLFYNDDSASKTVTIYMYPSGGSASATTTVLQKDIPPKETLIWSGGEKFILDTNDVVSAKADVASKVSVCVGYKVM